MARIRFLGGASKVGSLGMVLELDSGKRLLFDYGLTPSNPPEYPLRSPSVDMAFLTHAHVDHSGMVPWLTSTYGVSVVATEPTLTVSTVLATDSNKISGIEGYPIPYDENDIEEMKGHFLLRTFNEGVEFAGHDIRLLRAGHIPGAAMFHITGNTNMLFTGDINTVDTHLVKRAKAVDTDVLIIESTYAGREHEDRSVLVQRFLEAIDNVVDTGGKVLVPCFAVGRTQEVLLMLEGSNHNIFVDGMGKTITRLYMGESGTFVNSRERLRRAYKRANIVRSQAARSRALKEADVIITTSGMLDGGPIMEYLPTLAKSDKNAIFLTGYQVEGTNGRMLMETGFVEVAGVSIRPQARVEFFDFSAHSGHSQLLEFIDACSPSTVVMMHGDNREALAADLEGNYRTIMPMEGESIGL